MRVALLFIDGVGVGAADPAVNPLARGRWLLSQFQGGRGEPLPAGGARTDLDTTFGVAGRPQSATNQTAIFTGEPAARILGRHLLGFPNEPLRAVLREHSVIKRMVARGRRPTFANAYPRPYLQALGLPHRGAAEEAPLPPIPPGRLRRLRPSASTVAYSVAGVPLRTLEEAERGLGLTHDVEGRRARLRGLSVPERTPEEAAEVLWRIADGHDFVLFEHFLADEAGHGRDFALAGEVLGTFDRFARAAVERRPADAAVLIVSDHGNVEDLSTRNHTLHDVALLSFGVPPARLSGLRDVSDVGRLVLALVEEG
ncbi:MAG TPA: metalloenzyme [Myxococcales bacterium]|nr:metalloenzyme [Myxococcales bacterium]